MISPTISPHNQNVVVEHCDMTGAYLTADGGNSWRMFNLRAGVSTFTFDPGNASVIYAGNAALWRSEDSGKSWSMVFPDPRKQTSEHTWNDHAEYVLTTGDSSYPASGQEIDIQAIAVDPVNSNHIYLVFGSTFATQQPSSLYLSTNRGQSWQRLTEFAREKIYAVHVQSEADNRRVVYVVGESGVYEGREDKWVHRAGPGEKIKFASVGNLRGTQQVMFYATSGTNRPDGAFTGGIYTSKDGGRQWRNVTAGLISDPRATAGRQLPQFGAISCASRDAAAAYVGFRGLFWGRQNASFQRHSEDCRCRRTLVYRT